MSDVFGIILSILLGTILGVFFYGGLYWTVKKGINAKYPGLFFTVSFWVRTLVTLAGLLWISRGSLPRLLAFMTGLMIVRGISLYFEKGVNRRHSFLRRM